MAISWAGVWPVRRGRCDGETRRQAVVADVGDMLGPCRLCTARSKCGASLAAATAFSFDQQMSARQWRRRPRVGRVGVAVGEFQHVVRAALGHEGVVDSCLATTRAQRLGAVGHPFGDVQMMSGVTPKAAPVRAPERPKPVMTRQKSAGCCLAVQIRGAAGSPCGGMMTPADPDMGSTITAAMLLASCRAISLSGRPVRRQWAVDPVEGAGCGLGGDGRPGCLGRRSCGCRRCRRPRCRRSSRRGSPFTADQARLGALALARQ